MHRNFDYRKTVTRRSSWSDQALASRRFAHFYRSAKRLVQKEKTGCSSDRNISTAIIFTARSSTTISEKNFLPAATAPGRVTRPRNPTSNTKCSMAQTRFGNGWKPKARIFLSAATPAEWPRTSTQRCVKSFRTKAVKPKSRRTNTSKNSKQINVTSATSIRKVTNDETTINSLP